MGYVLWGPFFLSLQENLSTMWEKVGKSGKKFNIFEFVNAADVKFDRNI